MEIFVLMFRSGWRLFLFLPLLLASCNPATPPTPPAELPSALIFPRSVDIDVRKIQSASGASSLAALVGAGGEFSDVIAAGADTADAIGDVVDEILADFRELEIPVSASTTTFEGTITDTLDGEPHTFDVKIDFADYDLDGDGADEGCSSHTGSTPICFRLWLDGERMMAGLFDEYPTEENPGKGTIRIGLSGTPGEISGEGLFVGIVYDHFDPEDKATEFLALGLTTGFEEEGLPSFFSGRISVDQAGPDETARKTINMNVAFGSSETVISDSMEYLGRWREDDDLWSGSVFAVTDEGSASFSNICAQISTGNEVSTPLCEDLGIDVDGTPFVDLPAEGEVILPDDFPSAPTF